MIKLVVSDIDGTLLEDGGHELNPELFEVSLQPRAEDRGQVLSRCLIRSRRKFFICQIMVLMWAVMAVSCL